VDPHAPMHDSLRACRSTEREGERDVHVMGVRICAPIYVYSVNAAISIYIYIYVYTPVHVHAVYMVGWSAGWRGWVRLPLASSETKKRGMGQKGDGRGSASERRRVKRSLVSVRNAVVLP